MSASHVETSFTVLDPEEEATARLGGELVGRPGDAFAYTKQDWDGSTQKAPLGFQPPLRPDLETLTTPLTPEEQRALSGILDQLRELFDAPTDQLEF